MTPPLSAWIQATRPRFFPAIVVPVLLGTAVAYRTTGAFFPGALALTLLAAVLCHAGGNVLNDYFDHRFGADSENPDPITPFAGGSRMIQNGVLSPPATLRFGLALLGAGALAGLILVGRAGPGLLVIGGGGVFLAYFYSAPPFKLNYRGVGEIVIGLNFGLLPAAGAFLVQARRFDAALLLPALCVSILVALVLFVNEFPDARWDGGAGKKTWVVRWGVPASVRVFAFLLGLPYLVVLFGAATGAMPPLAATALLTFPLAFKIVSRLKSGWERPRELLPAIRTTIGLHAFFGTLLTTGYLA
jgi:1,4-dihydroxy-2-naphthoate octaprenyltransferase